MMQKTLIMACTIMLISCNKETDVSHIEPFNQYVGKKVKLEKRAYLLECKKEYEYEFRNHVLSPQKGGSSVIKELPVGTEVFIESVILYDKAAVGETIYAFGNIHLDSLGWISFEYYWSYIPEDYPNFSLKDPPTKIPTGLGRALWDNDSTTPKRREIKFP